VAIGTFDGVHLGHRRVLSGCDTALTFDPHPLRIIQPRLAPRLLTDHDQKLRKLRGLGIRRVAIVPFDQHWSEVSAQEFVEEVVVGRLGGEFVSVGEGFRFGARGTGTTTTLENHPQLRTRVVPLVTHGGSGVAISSTRIRGLVALGDVEQAACLLGEPLRLSAVAGSDGGLSIASGLAVPAAGLYRGLIDDRECLVHVRPDGQVDAPRAAHDGLRVQLSFFERLSPPAGTAASAR
jgi:riboflavin kinase/FMN adenylyltransferase